MSRLPVIAIVGMLVWGCGSSSPSSGSATSVDQMSPIQQAAIAFEGNHSEQAIQAKLDAALRLYGLPATDENYSRAGSALVALRKEFGVREMEILDYMIRSRVAGVNMSFPDAAGISAAFLASGDK